MTDNQDELVERVARFSREMTALLVLFIIIYFGVLILEVVLYG